MLVYESGTRAALDEVQQWGRRDNCEHVIVLRDGKQVWQRHGEPRRVGLERAPIAPGDVLVHNHPRSLNSLSSVDLAQLYLWDLSAVYAIASDESIFKASAVSSMPSAFFLMEWKAAFVGELCMLLAVADVAKIRNIKVEEAHWINMTLERRGVITYDFELGIDMCKFVDEVTARHRYIKSSPTITAALNKAVSTLQRTYTS